MFQEMIKLLVMKEFITEGHNDNQDRLNNDIKRNIVIIYIHFVYAHQAIMNR